MPAVELEGLGKAFWVAPAPRATGRRVAGWPRAQPLGISDDARWLGEGHGHERHVLWLAPHHVKPCGLPGLVAPPAGITGLALAGLIHGEDPASGGQHQRAGARPPDGNCPPRRGRSAFRCGSPARRGPSLYRTRGETPLRTGERSRGTTNRDPRVDHTIWPGPTATSPAPIRAPMRPCVVETGMPSRVARSTVRAAPTPTAARGRMPSPTACGVSPSGDEYGAVPFEDPLRF